MSLESVLTAWTALDELALARPWPFRGGTMDVHRFASHIAEHTIQCDKTLDALGWRQTEARRIVRQIWAIVGELEELGAVALSGEPATGRPAHVGESRRRRGGGGPGPRSSRSWLRA